MSKFFPQALFNADFAIQQMATEMAQFVYCNSHPLTLGSGDLNLCDNFVNWCRVPQVAQPWALDDVRKSANILFRMTRVTKGHYRPSGLVVSDAITDPNINWAILPCRSLSNDHNYPR
ncbi:hypothetical protein TNCV_3995901 [Trichonephila clavipes]|nr:hypothetical protein TNCV_3995901 [Trichonephila clavipes]